MGVLAKDDRQLTIYYHSGTSIGEQAFAYVNASEKKLRAIDLAKTPVTGTQWAELADGLGKPIADLIDQDHPDFRRQYGEGHVQMSDFDWLKVLEKEPHLLQYPIVIDGEKFLQLKSAAEFKEYIEPDSAGLEKTPLKDEFTGKERQA